MGMMTAAFQTVEDEDERRFPIPPGAVVLILALLFIGVIVVGIMLNNRSGSGRIRLVTIAELRSDPDDWDGRTVELVGHAEGVRELPFLSQYAIYTLRDDTGSMLTLTQKGAPPSASDEPVRVRSIFHSRITLEDELKRIAEDQLGPLGGAVVSLLVPGIPINVVYLEHQSYAPATTP
jgi:hypothetical protein